ncbi:hypothetical protein A0H81_03300 [Grifola frondosa]|uniref:DUF7770 domain-containing protein n=1 Tax=Grifola frondosa TaxID=5627 RepID=A0A1C7MI81_GRIFR|nr:hypothetical protein A0H81_03300 [Grifola frondosa]
MSTTFTRLFNPADRDHVIHKLIIAGSPVAPGSNSILHWRIYAVIHKRASVLFDFIPGGADGRTGVLAVKSVDYEVTFSAAAMFSVAMIKQITASALLDFFTYHKLDRYKFDDTGSGCLYWCCVALSKLEAAGAVPAGSVQRFEAYMAQLNAGNPARFPLPSRHRGTFY